MQTKKKLKGYTKNQVCITRKIVVHKSIKKMHRNINVQKKKSPFFRIIKVNMYF